MRGFDDGRFQCRAAVHVIESHGVQLNLNSLTTCYESPVVCTTIAHLHAPVSALAALLTFSPAAVAWGQA
jgi:hypothetical protein